MADTMAIADASEILEDSNENASGALDVQKPKDVTPNTFVSSITSNPLIKRALPALVGLFGVLLFTVLYLTLTASGTRSLYPNMSEEDRSEAYAILQSNDMNVSIDQANGALQIAENQYYEARMLLAANGLPRDGSSQSIDALANASSITSTQFMEQAQYTAAIEAELSRSIERISTVRSARVHLAAPRQSSYIRNRQPAKASVVIETQPGRIISPSQVQAIVNLVASSIPYLSVDDVSVVDQLGTLLTNREQSGLLEANEQAEFKRNLEEDYRSKILGLLGPVYGVENIRADIDLSLDFTEFESTSEFFDRNGSGPSTRSEMLSQDLSSSTAAEGIPGSTTNVAPADTVLTEVDNNQSQNQTSNVTSSQTTRNYEVDREIQYQKNPSGNITRINVAVVINEEAFLGENASAGEETPQIDTTNIERLVARAAGVDESRGDNVMVLVSRFAEVEVIPVQWYENELYIDYIKLVTIFLFFIIFSLIVLRPVVYGLLGVPLKIKTKTKVSKEDTSQRAISDQSGEEIETLDEEEVPLDDGAVYDGGRVLRTEKEMLERAEETGETLEDIKARLKPRKTNVTADMFDTANTYDDKVAIVRVLVEEDASRVASLLKKMLNAPRN
ncbi:MAG: flagellar basal-body MS-ring/collar protein FliF [Rhodospirillaceae bacterium]